MLEKCRTGHESLLLNLKICLHKVQNRVVSSALWMVHSKYFPVLNDSYLERTPFLENSQTLAAGIMNAFNFACHKVFGRSCVLISGGGLS